MVFISENRICEELVNSFFEKINFGLAIRVKENIDAKPFGGLKDWQLLSDLTINNTKLESNNIQFIAQEHFDEK